MVRGWWLAFRSQIALPRTTIERHSSDFLSFANPVNTRLPALKFSERNLERKLHTIDSAHRLSLTVLVFCNLRAAHVGGILCTLPMTVGPNHARDEFPHT